MSKRRMLVCAFVITALYVIASSMDLADELELDARRKEQAAQNIQATHSAGLNQGGAKWR
jgi:MinD-like ATPase involved in chromosome partitioning or flagellar assembly